MDILGILLLFTLSVIGTESSLNGNSQATMQLLKQFGMLGSSSTIPQITMGKGKRKGDSPIYYIKLPPRQPFFPVNTLLPPMLPPRNPFHRLPVDFINNGRPDIVHNWKYPPTILTTPTKPTYSPLLEYDNDYISDPFISNEIVSPSNPLELPSILPLIPTKPKRPIYQFDEDSTLMGNSLISLKDHYHYNGKPSSVYIWKPKRSSLKPKYIHPYFKHFNY